jgi:hypothetical protein
MLIPLTVVAAAAGRLQGLESLLARIAANLRGDQEGVLIQSRESGARCRRAAGSRIPGGGIEETVSEHQNGADAEDPGLAAGRSRSGLLEASARKSTLGLRLDEDRILRLVNHSKP